MTATWTTEFEKELKNYRPKRRESFIGTDGKRHEYVKGDDYKWHSGITNEEYWEHNDPGQLESCKKCSMWEICRKAEHTTCGYDDFINKAVDDLTKEIDGKILEQIVKK